MRAGFTDRGVRAHGRRSSFMTWLAVDDPGYVVMRRRILRLAAVSSVALGVLLWLARDGGATVRVSLVAGWATMPVVLVASLRLPRLKYLLAVPATLVSLPVTWLAVREPSPGWTLAAVGLQLGGAMGAWFWFRWAPIPGRLKDPDGLARRTLIAVHVTAVVAGMVATAFGA